ncbi:serine/threonine protein kinase, CMGC, dual-specificity [Coemansia spiralis]|uniref:dual-specificity kinase n=2 Tax=Coemansia TaxID=4863 RepID=A0A9W8KVG2_9FUNG|nr:serine/threonine protein kinase, CMGC, dual-specificity [Coemansia sp. RSA 1358]KAJ2670713.1 serine/threonine protein kinase, CMGC, dual-specificity [Coemansia spiralis]
MSRATASNFLNPQLRRRSRSGIFESSSTSPPSDGAGVHTDASLLSNAVTSAATIGAATRNRLTGGGGRSGIQRAERQYLQRPIYQNANSGTDEERSAVLATSAAAGAAGRPRRMTHQATRLTIDPERARAAGGDSSKRTPLTATGSGPSSGGRRFLRTPPAQDLRLSGSERQVSSSEKESGDSNNSASCKPESGASQSRGATNAAGIHRPLQAKLETSVKTQNSTDPDRAQPAGGTAGAATRTGRIGTGVAGAKLPTWRTQQVARESEEKAASAGSTQPQRTPATYTGVAGTKQALRESNSQILSPNRASDNSKNENDLRQQQAKLRQAQSKPTQMSASRNQGNAPVASSASAIGIGSYNSSYQAAGTRPGALRTGAAASVVGTPTAPAPNVPLQTHPVVGQGVRSQVASYQQRFGQQKGPSSVVSAAPAPAQQMMHINSTGSKAAGNEQPPATASQNLKQGALQVSIPPQPSQSRAQSSAHSASRLSGQTPDSQGTGGVPSLTPQEAIARYGQQLNAQERTEILEYPHVYYVGNAKARLPGRPSYGFDDERGDYIIHLHDHLLYRYEMLEVLGKGSFGQVLRARDHKTGEIVAIKIIRNRKRFHHQAQVEVKLLECLRRWDPSGAHNILQMTASFYFRSHLCIVMELLSINLYEWLKAYNFAGTPAELLRSFTIQMLQSLQLMGRHRIIHADLKPENILLVHPPPMPSRRNAPPGVGSGQSSHPLQNPQLAADMLRGAYAIKVIDLGSSCFETERVYTYIQSRFYRAPEVILGLPYGTGIDMWSLGCIAAEILTGYPLFPGENEREQLASIVEVLGPPPAYILERAPRCADFAEPVPYGVQATPVGNMMLLPNGACLVGSVVIKPYTSTKGKRRRPGSRPLAQVLARARDPRLIDFVMRTLAWDPAIRMTPEDALRHPWITDMPIQRQPGMSMGMGMAAAQQHAAHMGAPQPGYVMMPGSGAVTRQPHQFQTQHQQQAMAAHNGYIQPQISQQQAAYGNMARTRKA